jgi:hypothetical protein
LLCPGCFATHRYPTGRRLCRERVWAYPAIERAVAWARTSTSPSTAWAGSTASEASRRGYPVETLSRLPSAAIARVRKVRPGAIERTGLEPTTSSPDSIMFPFVRGAPGGVRDIDTRLSHYSGVREAHDPRQSRKSE